MSKREANGLQPPGPLLQVHYSERQLRLRRLPPALAAGRWPLAAGHQPLAGGHWLLATDHWPLATNHWLLATDHWRL